MLFETKQHIYRKLIVLRKLYLIFGKIVVDRANLPVFQKTENFFGIFT